MTRSFLIGLGTLALLSTSTPLIVHAQNRDSLPVSAREVYLACVEESHKDAQRAADSVTLVLKELAEPRAKSLDELHLVATPDDSEVVHLFQRVTGALNTKHRKDPAEHRLASFCRDQIPENYGASTDGAWIPWDSSDVPDRQTIHRFAKLLLGHGERPGNSEPFFLSMAPIPFDSTGSTTLTPLARVYLARVADYLRLHPSVTIDASGFADAVGTAAANKDVAARRAQAVIGELARLGIDPGRLQSHSYGSSLATEPADSSTKRRQVDRRVQLAFALAPQGESAERAAVSPTVQAPRDVTSAVVLGVADYLKDQATDEVRTYITVHMRKYVCTAKEFGLDYLPATCAMLDAGAKERSRLSDRYVPGPLLLREALVADIQHAPAALLTVVASRDTTMAVARRIALAQSALFTAQELSQGRDVESVVAALATWQPSASIAVRTDSIFRRLHRFGAIVDLAVAGRNEMGQYWGNRVAPADSLLRYALMAYVANDAPSMRQNLSSIEETVGLARRLNDYAMLADSLRETLRQSRDTSLVSLRLRDAAQIATLTNAIWQDVLAPQFTGIDPSQDSLILVSNRLSASLAAGAYGEALTELASMEREIAPQRPLHPDELRVLALAADVAQAHTAQEATQALQRFGGAYSGLSRKRDPGGHAYNGVNAYIGLAGGYEALPNRGTATNGGVLGAYAPVVYEWGWPNSQIRIYAQVVDVGALTSNRLGNRDAGSENSTSGDHVRLAQIVSPGIGIGRSIGDSPFVVGTVLSYNVQGRTIGSSTGDRVLDAVRLSLFTAVDVPIWIH